ncbi:hypothetical protein V6N11_004226 [Hibiscus sabdariffa]|uniref:Peptidase C1A papain C-terminal domain-containing protein n=1 Tax=Hibiscus sabdariffa TaxID=183260 RepID=A0ABR2SFM6_9ROSI
MDTEDAPVSRVELSPIVIPLGTPQRVDWREADVLNPVRDQGDCVCCWAFVAVTLLESVRKIKFPEENLKQLSPQFLLQCVCPNPPDNIVVGASKCYTYTKMDDFHPKLEPIDTLKIDDYNTIYGWEREKIFMTVADHPVAAVMDVTQELKDLKDGIYEGPRFVPPRGFLRHAVVIIGYGTDENTGKNFWLIQNSWGETWGVNGVGKVNRDVKVNGKYLVRRISYPIFHC